MHVLSHLDFAVPAGRVATDPPESRGLRRDQVRLLVAERRGTLDTRFDRLGEHLHAGDLLVVNTSPTIPAAVDATWRGRDVGIHFSTQHDDGSWTIELRQPDRSGPILDAAAGDVVALSRGSLELMEAADHGQGRLWRANVDIGGGLRRYLRRHGRPIRYAYVPRDWGLERYQTVFADRTRWPGSAEMPSAGRPFTNRLVRRLGAAGVAFAPIELHTGVSSQEAHETPQPERFLVTPHTAAAVNRTKARGGRIVAVGTTATRALETVTDVDGWVSPGAGWTDLVLSTDRPARVVNGLVTGWHPPEASHLALLEAVAGVDLVASAYQAALDGDYLWHEFGDSCLLLPGLPQ